VIDKAELRAMGLSGTIGSEAGVATAHRWDVSAAEARQIQERLRERVREEPLARAPRTVGGLDVHGARGAVAVLSWPTLEWVEGAVAEREVTYPYVLGLLSFRETPVLLAALETLDALPDVLLCDGQGLAHPRRFGLACHLGVWLERPTVGCAKTHLCGHGGEPGRERGAVVPLYQAGQVIGAVVRTRTAVRPLYVSVGHLITLPQAIEVVIQCAALPASRAVTHRTHDGQDGSRPFPGRLNLVGPPPRARGAGPAEHSVPSTSSSYIHLS
jgi:deoxyribonuclease V